MKYHYTHKDVGCWIDGAYGMEHNREKLISMVASCPMERIPRTIVEITPQIVRDVISALQEPMSDDDWETDMATDILQAATDPSLTWIWENGDLILTDDAVVLGVVFNETD